MNECICKKCGNSLVIEYDGSYGTIYHLKKDGTTGRKLKTIKYEHSGDYMVYCPNCGTGYDGRFYCEKFVPEQEATL